MHSIGHSSSQKIDVAARLEAVAGVGVASERGRHRRSSALHLVNAADSITNQRGTSIFRPAPPHFHLQPHGPRYAPSPCSPSLCCPSPVLAPSSSGQPFMKCRRRHPHSFVLVSNFISCFRGFFGDDHLTFVTDVRSSKARLPCMPRLPPHRLSSAALYPHIIYCSHAPMTSRVQVAELLASSSSELCWNFTSTREQFRISGHVTVVGNSREADPLCCDEWPNHTGLPLPALHEQRLLAWKNLSDAARASYLYLPPPPPHPLFPSPASLCDSSPAELLSLTFAHHMWPRPGIACASPPPPQLVALSAGCAEAEVALQQVRRPL